LPIRGKEIKLEVKVNGGGANMDIEGIAIYNQR